MSRARSPQRIERIDRIVDAALQVFLVRGYQRTRMTDVASGAEVSPGLLYTYAASKEALFHLVLQRELGADLAAVALPAPDPEPGETLALIRAALREVSRMPTLEAAATIDDPADPRAELAAIIGEHHDNIHRYRRVILLVERSALDWPELADRYYVKGRRPFVRRLSDYITRRVGSGHLSRVPDPEVAARYVIEVVAWFANHRYGDRDGALIDDAVARETVIELVTRSFGPRVASS